VESPQHRHSQVTALGNETADPVSAVNWRKTTQRKFLLIALARFTSSL
jgi:hypothetical protein